MPIHGKFVSNTLCNMERAHGMTYSGGEANLHEYWEAYQKMMEETKMLDDYLDEECSPRSYDGKWLLTFFINQKKKF